MERDFSLRRRMLFGSYGFSRFYPTLKPQKTISGSQIMTPGDIRQANVEDEDEREALLFDAMTNSSHDSNDEMNDYKLSSFVKEDDSDEDLEERSGDEINNQRHHRQDGDKEDRYRKIPAPSNLSHSPVVSLSKRHHAMVSCMNSRKPFGTDYIGYDRLTSSDTIYRYVETLNNISERLMPKHTPVFINSYWPPFNVRSVLEKEIDRITTDDILVLYKYWLHCINNENSFLYDQSRAVFFPIHDRANCHWFLIVVFPFARHAVLLCSLYNSMETEPQFPIIHDQIEQSPSCVATTHLMYIQKMLAFSRKIRAVRKYFIKKIKGPEESCSEQVIRDYIAEHVDNTVFRDEPTISYSFVHYKERQRHNDCGVYVLNFMRMLLLGTANTESLRFLARNTMTDSMIYRTKRDHGAVYLKKRFERVDSPLMRLFIRERRATQIHVIVQEVANSVDRTLIERSRVNILTDMLNPKLMHLHVKDTHPSFVDECQNHDEQTANASIAH